MLGRGITNWGEPVQDVLDDGALLINQAASADGPGLVSILLEGSANAGKTALGAQLAKNSNFPFVKICRFVQNDTSGCDEPPVDFKT